MQDEKWPYSNPQNDANLEFPQRDSGRIARSAETMKFFVRVSFRELYLSETRERKGLYYKGEGALTLVSESAL